MIPDLTDQCWKNAFTTEELQEIRDYQAIDMPPMPSDVTSYLNQLQGLNTDDLYKKVHDDDFPMESDLEWVSSVLSVCVSAGTFGFLPHQQVNWGQSCQKSVVYHWQLLWL